MSLTPSEAAGVELVGYAKRTGPAVNYLTVRTTDTDPIPHWYEVTHWVDADTQMVFTHIGITQIRMLWRIARHRYVTPESKRVGVGFLEGMTPNETIMKKDKPHDEPMIVNDFTMRLQYWKREISDADHQPDPTTIDEARKRLAARVGTLVPKGWRLREPEQFEGGWRLGYENVVDPNLSPGVWDESFDEALRMVEAMIKAAWR
jgi:hypothetical protein